MHLKGTCLERLKIKSKNKSDFIRNCKKEEQLTALMWKTAMSSKYGLNDSLNISPAGTLNIRQKLNLFITWERRKVGLNIDYLTCT